MKKQLDVTKKKFNFLSLHLGCTHGCFFFASPTLAIGRYGLPPRTLGCPRLLGRLPELVDNKFIYKEEQSHFTDAPAIIEANLLESDILFPPVPFLHRIGAGQTEAT